MGTVNLHGVDEGGPGREECRQTSDVKGDGDQGRASCDDFRGFEVLAPITSSKIDVIAVMPTCLPGQRLMSIEEQPAWIFQ